MTSVYLSHLFKNSVSKYVTPEVTGVGGHSSAIAHGHRSLSVPARGCSNQTFRARCLCRPLFSRLFISLFSLRCRQQRADLTGKYTGLLLPWWKVCAKGPGPEIPSSPFTGGPEPAGASEPHCLHGAPTMAPAGRQAPGTQSKAEWLPRGSRMLSGRSALVAGREVQVREQLCQDLAVCRGAAGSSGRKAGSSGSCPRAGGALEASGVGQG